MTRNLCRAIGVAAAVAMLGATGPSFAADTGRLPATVLAALARAQVPRDALAVVVQPVDSARPLLSWRADQPMNPASVFKLVTTEAALDLLGADFEWSTPVWLDGKVSDGVLDGNLVIKGEGDPTLVVERIWLLLQRVRAFGVRTIAGDIVIDRSAFAPAQGDPADFDGEPLRPYNVAPDALMLAQRSVIYRFIPEPGRGVARVEVQPRLDGVQVDPEVPLSSAPCGDWRAALEATAADPLRMHFAGRYPQACGEQQWPLAYPDPARFDARLLTAMWRDAGGNLGAGVRDGAAPTSPPSFVVHSPPLPEVVRDINKFSNNVMAQQLFLTLGRAQRGAGTADNARAVLAQWLADALHADAGAVRIDNGSGLSRSQRISAEVLARLLVHAWRGPLMPELAASLPLVGVDGTLRRMRAASGRAHLKSGSLRDVAAVAGFVLGADGRRRVVVAMIEHPQARAARPAIDALVDWAASQPLPPAPAR